MSRRLIAVYLVMLFFLTGCRRQSATPPLSTDFTCSFHAQYQNLTATGTLTRYTAGTLKLEFSEPETLSGLSAEWDGESVTLRYLGLTYTVDPGNLPESALGEALLTAFDAALRGEGTAEENGDRMTLTGNGYTYVYDANSGAPLSLTAPSIPLTVTFSNSKAN